MDSVGEGPTGIFSSVSRVGGLVLGMACKLMTVGTRAALAIVLDVRHGLLMEYGEVTGVEGRFSRCNVCSSRVGNYPHTVMLPIYKSANGWRRCPFWEDPA
jgi:hypothetical protein